MGVELNWNKRRREGEGGRGGRGGKEKKGEDVETVRRRREVGTCFFFLKQG